MTYLVDANVLSEATRPEPNDKVVRWLTENESEIVVDPVILGEIRYGILLLNDGEKRRRLEQWFYQGVHNLVCVPYSCESGLRWAKLLADLRRAGKSMPIKDSLIAATALVHDLTVVTRNKDDFEKSGAKVINPFED